MRKVFYYLFRTYLFIQTHIFFRKIKVKGIENIPKKGPVIFLANHQNAFLDAVLIVCNNHRFTYFLTRSDIFKPSTNWILGLLNLIPIYRMRDGINTLSKNEEVFERCNELLLSQKSIIMFPEGNHDDKKRLRPISKGFTRVVFGFLEAHPDQDLQIVPVGINYINARKFRTRCSLLFGSPILANTYFDKDNVNESINELKSRVSEKMSKLIVHIQDLENYNSIYQQLIESGVDLTDPVEANQLIQSLKPRGHSIQPPVKNHWDHSVIRKILALHIYWINFLWMPIYRSVKDKVFIGSLKFGFNTLVIPLLLIIQITIAGIFLPTSGFMIYLLFILLFPTYFRYKDDLS